MIDEVQIFNRLNDLDKRVKALEKVTVPAIKVVTPYVEEAEAYNRNPVKRSG